jgi:hypothetical protein
MRGRNTVDGGLQLALGAAAVVAAAFAVLLMDVAGASAAIRYAAPGGNNVPGSECLQTNPCSLFNAADRNAPASSLEEGDEVIVLPGTYSGEAGELGLEATVVPRARITIHGLADRPRPVIVVKGGNGGSAFLLNEPGDTLSHLEILASDDSGPWTLASPTSVIDGVVAISRGTQPCFARAGLVRNSVCLSTSDFNPALDALPETPPGALELRNFTAVATGAEAEGITARGFEADDEVKVHGIGVLARGAGADVAAIALSLEPHEQGTGSKVTVDLDHSDFAEASTVTDDGKGIATVPTPGAGTNITAAPLLAADGYHQLPGSRTIDAGAVDPLSGSADVDGESRTAGGAPDIGADELQPPAPPAAAPRPNTILKRKPPLKTKSRKATFTFTSNQAGSRFECKLDRKRFKPCRSPFKVKGLKRGRHTFKVRAVGRTGADPTPAVFRWRVL